MTIEHEFQWQHGLTDEQISMVLTCLANRYPLCCESGYEMALVIANGDRKVAKRINTYAYDRWGCTRTDGANADERKWLDRFFMKALNDVASAIDAVDGSDWPDMTDPPNMYAERD